MIQLEIHGKPVPCNSHKKSGSGHIYDPRKKEKEYAQWQIKAQFNQEAFKCPLEIEIHWYFKPPKKTSSVRRRQMLANIIKHSQRPDADNLEKFTLDVLKGIVFDDDSRPWKIIKTKLWGEEEKTLIRIKVDSIYVK